jgi:hypothetical protein
MSTDHHHVATESAITRRRVMRRFGQWSIGVAAATAGLVATARPASALSGQGCCNLAYNYYCSGIEWSNSCGNCGPGTNALGYPSGKWWWTCNGGVPSGRQRFCGECYYGSCSYTYVYTGSPTKCN